MTYLQLMVKCLNFFKDQKEEFDNFNFYFHWLGNEDKDIDLYYKSKARKAILYLILSETQKCKNVDIPLLKLLEKDLSYFDSSLCKTIETAEQNTISSIAEDQYMLDQICLCDQDELTDEEKNAIITDLFNEFIKQIPDDFQTQQYESAIHNVMEMVSQIIPELFFTEAGYRYIDKEYQVEDIKLRARCYEYLQENIKYYNLNRIYKADENVYNFLHQDDRKLDDFEDNEDLDDEGLFLDADEIREQVDIYGEDLDNYDILHYSVTLLIVMLRFIKNKQYDKLIRLIELDEAMTNFFDDLCYNKTLIEALYQPKTMKQDYHREISISMRSDEYLEFFLSNNDFTQQYNSQQLSLIMAYCFDFFDSKPLETMIKKVDMINNAFSTTDSNNQEENIKKLVKIRKANNNE